jgi:hypothetical protein
MAPDEDDVPPWPIADLVAVARTTLIQRGEWETKRPYPPPPPNQAPQREPPNLGGEDEARIYPFTKGIEIANEGIGYGEETTVSVVNNLGMPGKQQRRRRTRTGSIVLEPLPPPVQATQLGSPPSDIPQPSSLHAGHPAASTSPSHHTSQEEDPDRAG